MVQGKLLRFVEWYWDNRDRNTGLSILIDRPVKFHWLGALAAAMVQASGPSGSWSLDIISFEDTSMLAIEALWREAKMIVNWYKVPSPTFSERQIG